LQSVGKRSGKALDDILSCLGKTVDEADDAADDAVSSGGPIELDPLPPFERRIVHEYLRERGDVETHSEGDEPERYLVVTPRAGG